MGEWRAYRLARLKDMERKEKVRRVAQKGRRVGLRKWVDFVFEEGSWVVLSDPGCCSSLYPRLRSRWLDVLVVEFMFGMEKTMSGQGPGRPFLRKTW